MCLHIIFPDVVCDADREIQLRVLDTDDAHDDWRQSMNQTVAQANSYQGKIIFVFMCSPSNIACYSSVSTP